MLMFCLLFSVFGFPGLLQMYIGDTSECVAGMIKFSYQWKNR